MAHPVVWSARARDDLRLAVAHIALDSQESAARFGRAVMTVARSLSSMAERGRVVPELDDPGVREVLLGRYRIIYEVLADRVVVVRVLHGSRDLLLVWGRRNH